MAKINILGSDYNDLHTLIGVAVGDTNLGTFPGGTTISDNTDVKSALAEIETALEAITSVDIANDSDNRVITAEGDSTFNAEANLTFDGSTLGVTGKVSTTEAGTTYLSVVNTAAANSQASAYIFGGTSSGNSNIAWRSGSSLNLGVASSVGGSITNVLTVGGSGEIDYSDNAKLRTFSNTINFGVSTDIFTITSANHGAMAMRVSIVCNTSGFSVAKIYDVVRQFNTTPIFNLVANTGPYSGDDFSVSFSSTGNLSMKCTVTNDSSSINGDFVTTLELAGSATGYTIS